MCVCVYAWASQARNSRGGPWETKIVSLVRPGEGGIYAWGACCACSGVSGNAGGTIVMLIMILMMMAVVMLVVVVA